MKGGINDRLLNRDMRPYSACVSAASQDYLITTMKLRDQIMASKPQKPNSSSKLIRNMRSAPPFQNRNLDNYPMPHSRDDAVRSARGQRADKRYSAVRMTKSRAESGLMREYSKQMFDFSVTSVKNIRNKDKMNTGTENCKNSQRSKSETDCYVALRNKDRTNGPTPDGSALHNRRQKVLNSIRIRPHTECQTQFRHERTASSSNVQHAICDKNRRYRVRSVTETSARPRSHFGNVSLAGSDFIFIPVDQSSHVNGWVSNERTNSRRVTVDGSLSESNETDSLDATFGRDPFDDFDDKNTMVNEDNVANSSTLKNSFSYTSCSRSLLPPDVSSNMRLVSLDEASSSESEEEKVEPEVEVKKPEPPPPPPPQPKSKARGKKSGRKTAKVTIVEEEKSKIPEPEPEPEPVKVKLILKGPHCWVDDATITSEQSDKEDVDCPDGANITSGVQNDLNAEKQNSAQKLDIASKTKSLMKGAVAANTKPALSAVLKQPNQQAMKEAFDKALQKNVQSSTNAMDKNGDVTKQLPETNETNNGLTADKDKENEQAKEEIILPPFLCPSSEKKSREAALKDWLSKTCFRSGHKPVPVL